MDLGELLDSPFTARQAREAGLSPDALRWLCRLRVIEPVLHGVYVGSHVEQDLAVRAAAVSLVVPADAVLCRRTAAFLHGVDLRVPAEPPLPVEVLVPPGTTPPRRAGCIAHQAAIPAADIATIHGIPVTTGQRTALDLARLRPRVEAIVAVDLLAHRGLCDVARLGAMVPALRHQRGVRQLREVVRLADPRSESPMETRLRLVLVDGGLPTPEVQWEVLDGYGFVVARFDLAYPKKLVAIEYDGWLSHAAKPQFDHDRDRQNAIFELQDWKLRRYVDRHVFRTPSLIVRQVGQLLAA